MKNFLQLHCPRGRAVVVLELLRTILSLGALSDDTRNRTKIWFLGPSGNTKSCDAILDGGMLDRARISRERRLRGSGAVPRAPRGETPQGYSPQIVKKEPLVEHYGATETLVEKWKGGSFDHDLPVP
jgi:hypothetical protein